MAIIASSLALCFNPNASMESDVGPTKVIFASCNNFTNSLFSLRKPILSSQRGASHGLMQKTLQYHSPG